jgi:hypothetical protein
MFEPINKQPFGELSSVDKFLKNPKRHALRDGYVKAFAEVGLQLDADASSPDNVSARKFIGTLSAGIRAAQRVLENFELEPA